MRSFVTLSTQDENAIVDLSYTAGCDQWPRENAADYLARLYKMWQSSKAKQEAVTHKDELEALRVKLEATEAAREKAMARVVVLGADRVFTAEE